MNIKNMRVARAVPDRSQMAHLTEYGITFGL